MRGEAGTSWSQGVGVEAREHSGKLDRTGQEELCGHQGVWPGHSRGENREPLSVSEQGA